MPVRDPKRAERLRPPRWRDPKLVIGALIVAVSLLGTWFVVRQAADTITVWTAARPLVPGHTITEADVAAAEVRIDDAESVYLPATAQFPAGATVLSTIAPGELIPASQLGTPEQLAGRVLAVDVPGGLPSQVEAGSLVDLWGTDMQSEGADPTQLLTNVSVISVSRDTGGFGSSSEHRLEIYVPADELRTVMAAVAGQHHLSVAAVPEAGGR